MISEEKKLEVVVEIGVAIVVIECQEIHHPIPENNHNDMGT